MSSHDLLIIVLFIGILVAFTPLLGKWLANVLQGKRSWLSPVLGPVERCTYRVAGVDPSREMDWKKYLTAVLLFNAAGFLILFLSLLCQKWLPLNPAGTENMRWDIALNTAISFMTNTNWQFYSGGQVRRLSDLKGKVVLLDFHLFASKESTKRIMMLRELYNKYHAAGLEIYQVSIDPDEHFWKTSTAAIPWICVRDEDGIQGKSLTLYNVQSIPTFFLIDRSNTLQARDAQIKDIEAAIKNLL